MAELEEPMKNREKQQNLTFCVVACFQYTIQRVQSLYAKLGLSGVCVWRVNNH